jgi:hypothetical protein
MAVSDAAIDKVRSRLDVTVVTMDATKWNHETTPAIVRWLSSDEAEGQFVIGQRDWIFTHAATAFAFKLRFG